MGTMTVLAAGQSIKIEEDVWALSTRHENPFYFSLQRSTQDMQWHAMFVSMNQLPTWLVRLQKAAWCSLTRRQEGRAKLWMTLLQTYSAMYLHGNLLEYSLNVCTFFPPWKAGKLELLSDHPFSRILVGKSSHVLLLIACEIWNHYRI